MEYGYARVSTEDQTYNLQIDALQRYGVKSENIIVETVSGGVAPDKREELSTLIEKLQAEDTLVVWKLDRLGRSALDMLSLDMLFRERKIKLVSLTEGVDTDTPAGQFYYSILAALAQMERATIRERINAGLAAARLRGKTLGRPRKLRTDIIRQVQLLKRHGETISCIVKALKISRATVYRALRAEIPE